MKTKLNNFLSNEMTQKNLEIIKKRYGLITNSEAIRISLALVAGESK